MIHIQMTMRSVALDYDTKVDVLLPENRHVTVDTRGKKYPVLYVLHGGKEDNSSWMNLSSLFLNCRDLDLIVVMPSNYNGCYIDGKYTPKYYTYVAEELPVKMKNIFPISDRPEDTFIMGESMGGYGTLHVAMSKPENYAKAVCLSGGNISPNMFHDRHHEGVFGTQEEWETSDNNLNNLVHKLKNYEGHTPEFIFYCGTDDHGYARNKAFQETFAKECPNISIKSEYWPGEHNFFFWNEAIPKALKEFGFTIEKNSMI